MKVPANFHACFLQKLCSLTSSFLASVPSDEEVDNDGASGACALLGAAAVTGGILVVWVCVETVEVVAWFNALFSTFDCVVDGNGELSMTEAVGVDLLAAELIWLTAGLLGLDFVTVEVGLTAVDCAQ